VTPARAPVTCLVCVLDLDLGRKAERGFFLRSASKPILIASSSSRSRSCFPLLTT
jgi:hypothetical protein